MCTLVVAFYPGTEFPLVIGSNRDEDPTRPSEGWKNREKGKLFCPLDVRGGTWIGVSKTHKSFCAITNWDIMDERLHGMESRGMLVYKSLLERNPADRFWDTLDAKRYKPFTILWGNAYSLYSLQCNHEEMIVNQLSPGIHISTGWGLNQTDEHAIRLGDWKANKREAYIYEHLMREFYDFSQPVNPDSMFTLLREHNDGKGSDNSVCVHDEENHRWETVSSAITTLDSDSKFKIKSLEGKPCEAKLMDWRIHEL